MRVCGELRVSHHSARDTSRRGKAGRRTGRWRRVRVPAPEEKQGVRASLDDDVRGDGLARPAGGEERVAAVIGHDTRFVLVAVLSSERGEMIDIVPEHHGFPRRASLLLSHLGPLAGHRVSG
jgi:hypothetical protein